MISLSLLLLAEAAQRGSLWREEQREAEDGHSKGAGLCPVWAAGQLLANPRLCLYNQIAKGGSHVLTEPLTTAEPTKGLLPGPLLGLPPWSLGRWALHSQP